jgi:hypothetical protein
MKKPILLSQNINLFSRIRMIVNCQILQSKIKKIQKAHKRVRKGYKVTIQDTLNQKEIR